MKILDFVVIGISVFWISLPVWYVAGRTGEGLGYDLGSQSGGVIVLGGIYLAYRIYQSRKKTKVELS